jgi:L-cysteine/cystine lyase
LSDQTHLQRIRQELPATTTSIYLNTGTFGPLPGRVIRAMQERLQNEWGEGRLGSQGFGLIPSIYSEARRSVARLLNASEEEIALTGCTGEGMNIISYGLNWQEGDEVITTNHEHISALGPLYQIRDRYGIVIRIADLEEQADRSVLEAVSELITPRTRLISISHVTWSTGAQLDVAQIGHLGRERGIPVLIDGAQSAGAIPIDVKELGVDFYSIPMQKWLCGPDGAGALYARQGALQHMRPTYVGYWSAKHEQEGEWEIQANAQRFEAGGRHTAALVGQGAALNWLESEVGYQWIFERIAHLHRYAYYQLKKIPGLTLLTPRAGASGLIAFKLEGKNDAEVVKHLSEVHTIYIRNIPSTNALRVSTGFYNTEEEIEALAQALAAL